MSAGEESVDQQIERLTKRIQELRDGGTYRSALNVSRVSPICGLCGSAPQ